MRYLGKFSIPALILITAIMATLPSYVIFRNLWNALHTRRKSNSSGINALVPSIELPTCTASNLNKRLIFPTSRLNFRIKDRIVLKMSLFSKLSLFNLNDIRIKSKTKRTLCFERSSFENSSSTMLSTSRQSKLTKLGYLTCLMELVNNLRRVCHCL